MSDAKGCLENDSSDVILSKRDVWPVASLLIKSSVSQLDSWKPYLLLLPSLLGLFAFTYLPIGTMLADSFMQKVHGLDQVHFVGLDNYARLFADPIFRGAVLNNTLFTLGTVFPSLVLSLFFALMLEKASRVNSLLRGLFFFPSLMPFVGAAALCSFIFMPGIGLLDYYLAKAGIRGINWIGDPDLALWSLTGLSVWKNAGYYMLFYLAGLQAIPAEVKEASLMEGASSWQNLRHVTLPMLAPTTAFVLVISLIFSFTQVDHVIVLTKGGPSNATNLLLYYIYLAAVENFDYGRAAAASVVSVAALFLVSFTSMRVMEKGMRHG